MRSIEGGNELIYTMGEWFLATLTAVGTKGPEPCDNWPCSWEANPLCNNLKALDLTQDAVVTGNHVTGRNPAYPISGSEPTVGSTVLMRFRGSDPSNLQIYEFLEFDAGGGVPMALTAIQCSGDVLSATYSEGCVRQA